MYFHLTNLAIFNNLKILYKKLGTTYEKMYKKCKTRLDSRHRLVSYRNMWITATTVSFNI
jgi:hypothetical protein